MRYVNAKITFMVMQGFKLAIAYVHTIIIEVIVFFSLFFFGCLF